MPSFLEAGLILQQILVRWPSSPRILRARHWHPQGEEASFFPTVPTTLRSESLPSRWPAGSPGPTLRLGACVSVLLSGLSHKPSAPLHFGTNHRTERERCDSLRRRGVCTEKGRCRARKKDHFSNNTFPINTGFMSNLW